MHASTRFGATTLLGMKFPTLWDTGSGLLLMEYVVSECCITKRVNLNVNEHSFATFVLHGKVLRGTCIFEVYTGEVHTSEGRFCRQI